MSSYNYNQPCFYHNTSCTSKAECLAKASRRLSLLDHEFEAAKVGVRLLLSGLQPVLDRVGKCYWHTNSCVSPVVCLTTASRYIYENELELAQLSEQIAQGAVNNT